MKIRPLAFKIAVFSVLALFLSCKTQNSANTGSDANSTNSNGTVQEVPSSQVSLALVDPNSIQQIVFVSNSSSGGLGLVSTDSTTTDSGLSSAEFGGILGGAAGGGLIIGLIGAIGYKYFKSEPSSESISLGNDPIALKNTPPKLPVAFEKTASTSSQSDDPLPQLSQTLSSETETLKPTMVAKNPTAAIETAQQVVRQVQQVEQVYATNLFTDPLVPLVNAVKTDEGKLEKAVADNDDNAAAAAAAQVQADAKKVEAIAAARKPVGGPPAPPPLPGKFAANPPKTTAPAPQQPTQVQAQGLLDQIQNNQLKLNKVIPNDKTNLPANIAAVEGERPPLQALQAALANVRVAVTGTELDKSGSWSQSWSSSESEEEDALNAAKAADDKLKQAVVNGNQQAQMAALAEEKAALLKVTAAQTTLVRKLPTAPTPTTAAVAPQNSLSVETDANGKTFANIGTAKIPVQNIAGADYILALDSKTLNYLPQQGKVVIVLARVEVTALLSRVGPACKNKCTVDTIENDGNTVGFKLTGI